MDERVPISIFPNMLPTSYIFLDDGSDASKWMGNASSPFDSITEGDLYGYYGKGLAFHHNANGNKIAVRSMVISPVLNFECSFTVRPDPALYVGAWNDHHLLVEFFLPTSGTFDQRVLAIGLETAADPLGGVGYGAYRIGFANSYTGNLTNIIHTQNWVRKSGVNDYPWIRVKCIVVNGIAVSLKINGAVYAVTQAPFTDNNHFPSCVFLHGKNGSGGAADWFIDQISVSETENIV